ncbi:hypothetical protein V4890_09175 [Ralstonia solanacearum species complex bacterium KE056]|uniref:hypothetical protein n=1 Tax=Ralstonia solanacearum species complex bacterium KE056 TaxID=3119585 RepID=UPI002FC39CEA
MIFSPVRAIAIDNNGLELLSIVNGLSAQGVPCSAHLYDAGDLIPSPPTEGYRHLRLAFVDMNLLDTAGLEAKNVASIITTVLRKVIAPDCGPYTLIFWTSFPEKVAEVEAEVLRQFEQQGLSAPAQISHLGKANLIPLTNGGEMEGVNIGLREHFEAQAKLSDKLGSSLSDSLKSSGSAAVASAWETLLSEAASETLAELYAEAKEIADRQPNEAFADVLATIAVEAVGRKNAREEPLAGLTEGLLELVLDHLRSVTSSDTAEEVVKAQLSQRIKSGPPSLPRNTVAQINRLFQVELLSNDKPITRISRGIVLSPTEAFLRDSGLDEGWASFLWREMLHDPVRLDSTDSRKAVLLERKDEITRRVKPLLIEVGADCDHAQRKPRSHRFLLAAEVPADCFEEFVASSAPDRRTPYASDAIEVFGPWILPGDSLTSIAVCCKRFLSRQTDSIPASCKAVMRVRNAVVNHLLHRYSTLSTRPGFISL